MQKTIVVACGMGVVSSGIMRQALEELLWRNRVEAGIIVCRHSQLWQHTARADLIVAAVQPSIDTDCPIVMGHNFLTGVGVEHLEQTILSHLVSDEVQNPERV